MTRTRNRLARHLRTVGRRAHRRCQLHSRMWCGPGAGIPRSRLAAQSWSVETGTPVILFGREHLTTVGQGFRHGDSLTLEG